MESAPLGAARLSPRGGGEGPGGGASPWECRAAQSCQARPEKVQEQSWGTVKGGSNALAMLHYGGAEGGEARVHERGRVL